jgi:hypothetical protein
MTTGKGRRSQHLTSRDPEVVAENSACPNRIAINEGVQDQLMVAVGASEKGRVEH